jgi:S-adenosylmethionine:tRNA ribosyltransferase-isomerase
MRKQDFAYPLPEELIAQFPPDKRGDSRLLFLDAESGQLQDMQFRELPGLLESEDLLIFNDTRVIPARLYGQKESGGKVEIMVERITGDRKFIAQLRFSKAPRVTSVITLEQGSKLRVAGRQSDMFVLEIMDDNQVMDMLEKEGHTPLPPYIDREDQAADRERYQTVYAQTPGAVAAPTAGLHFDKSLLQKIRKQNIEFAFITLHIGAGTFQPVRTDNIEEHRMHNEYLEVEEEVCHKVKQAKARGGRIIAVGTTTVRSLETAAGSGVLQPYAGETDIFIYPGYEFRVVDALVTNFHLPESTLLMLVCAFAGRENIMHAYQHAIRQQYRFYSYGDAMFINKQ